MYFVISCSNSIAQFPCTLITNALITNLTYKNFSNNIKTSLIVIKMIYSLAQSIRFNHHPFPQFHWYYPRDKIIWKGVKHFDSMGLFKASLFLFALSVWWKRAKKSGEATELPSTFSFSSIESAIVRRPYGNTCIWK